MREIMRFYSEGWRFSETRIHLGRRSCTVTMYKREGASHEEITLTDHENFMETFEMCSRLMREQWVEQTAAGRRTRKPIPTTKVTKT